MGGRGTLALFAFALSGYGQPPSPEVLARVRAAALTYADKLQDFTCTQVTVRSLDKTGTGQHWKRVDVQEQELDYVGHRESYRLLKVNGRPVNPGRKLDQGLRSTGEFGSALRYIFEPRAHANFEWDSLDSSSGRPLCVFRYAVAEENSRVRMGSGKVDVRLGHHGFIYADCETGAVMRMQLQAGFTDKPTGLELDLRYGPASIGEKEFLLPQSAVEISRFEGKHLYKLEIRFEHYRKYDSSSSVTFGEEAGKPTQQPVPVLVPR